MNSKALKNFRMFGLKPDEFTDQKRNWLATGKL